MIDAPTSEEIRYLVAAYKQQRDAALDALARAEAALAVARQRLQETKDVSGNAGSDL